MKVKALMTDDEIEIKDFHSDPVDDFFFFPKIMPSSARKQLIEYANKKNISELMAIVEVLCERFK